MTGINRVCLLNINLQIFKVVMTSTIVIYLFISPVFPVKFNRLSYDIPTYLCSKAESVFTDFRTQLLLLTHSHVVI